MTKKASHGINYTLNSVAIEGYTDAISLNVEPEVPVVTTFGDAGPRRVPGNYDWNVEIGGSADFASGAIDATLFAMLGSTGVTSALDPTGTSAATNDPNYDGSVVLGSYSITGAVGEAVKYSARLPGTSALTRAVA